MLHDALSIMDETNRTDNAHWEDETGGSAEFSAFNRLASMLISVPSDRIRSKLEDVKKGAEGNTTPVHERPETAIEGATRKDPD